MALHEGVVPPTVGHEEEDPEIGLDIVPNQAREATVDAALSNSFAFGGLNAVLAINPNALADARKLDEEFKAGQVRGVLHGVPILLKDNIDTLDMPTTAGSLALQDNMTARDSPLVARLRAAGAVILGKANMSEWANARGRAAIRDAPGYGICDGVAQHCRLMLAGTQVLRQDDFLYSGDLPEVVTAGDRTQLGQETVAAFTLIDRHQADAIRIEGLGGGLGRRLGIGSVLGRGCCPARRVGIPTLFCHSRL